MINVLEKMDHVTCLTDINSLCDLCLRSDGSPPPSKSLGNEDVDSFLVSAIAANDKLEDPTWFVLG